MILRRFVFGMDTVSEWIGKIMSFSIPLMVVVLAIEVMMRYVFGRPTAWVYETSIFIFGYSFLLGGVFALKRGAMIRMDVLYGQWSQRTKAICDLITSVLFFVFIPLLIYETTKFAVHSWVTNEHSWSAWAPSLVHYRFVAPVAAFLLLLEGIAIWIKDLYFIIHKKELTK